MRTRPYRLAVVTFDEMDLLDIAGPLEVFSSAGRKWNWRAIKAELVSSSGPSHTTRAQLHIGPASELDSCPQPELVLIPGGYGARRALSDQVLLDYLRSIAPHVTLTLAIGLGTLLGASAGLLRDAEVASSLSLGDELTTLDASITPRLAPRVVSSARAITAAQTGCAIELGLEVVSRLLGKKQADGTAQEIGYLWGTETVAVDIKP